MLAEAGDGGPDAVTLELLTEARVARGDGRGRGLGMPTPASLAGPLGEYGATTLYDVGDLGGALPGVPVAAALAALDRGRQRARRHPAAAPPTTGATSPAGCRSSSTARC